MNTDNKFDYLFKIMLIGDSGVGKSSIMIKYADNLFYSNYISTIGIDFKITNEIINDKKAKLQIWDTAGQERFRSIVASYYRGANGIIIVYDITNRQSFYNIYHWINELMEKTNRNINILLVGNKCDMNDDRKVSYDEAKQFADNNDLLFIETSAKTSENIKFAFTKLTENMIDNLTRNENKKHQSTKSHIVIQKINNTENENKSCYCYR